MPLNVIGTVATCLLKPRAMTFSVRVNGTVYVIRYQDPIGLKAVESATGREVLVLIGEKTITYNDILGHSYEVPIVSSSPLPPSISPNK